MISGPAAQRLKKFLDVQRRKNEARCHLQAAERISRPALKEIDQVTLDLLLRNLRQDVESQQFEGDYLVLSHLSGLHLDLPDLLQAMPTAQGAREKNNTR